MTYFKPADNTVVVTAPVTGTISVEHGHYRITDLDGMSHPLNIDRCEAITVVNGQTVNRDDVIATTAFDLDGLDEGLCLAEHAVDVTVATLVERFGGTRVDVPTNEPNRPYCVGVVTPRGHYTATAQYGEVVRLTGPGINELVYGVDELNQLISEGV